MFKYNLPFEEYLAAEGISQSQLKKLAECPLKYKYFVLENNNQPPTEAMKTGSAFHTLVLEPELFKNTYHIIPKMRRSGPKWTEEQDKAGEKEILWLEEYEALAEMLAAINKHPQASAYLEGAQTEVSMFWEEDGLKCKGRIDAIKKFGDKVALLDLKTTMDANRGSFNREVFNRRYDIQAAYYMDGYKAITGIEPEIFVFIAIEKSAPYIVHLHYLTKDDEAIKYARDEYISSLDKYIMCNEHDSWDDGYGQANHLRRPAYM